MMTFSVCIYTCIHKYTHTQTVHEYVYLYIHAWMHTCTCKSHTSVLFTLEIVGPLPCSKYIMAHLSLKVNEMLIQYIGQRKVYPVEKFG